MRRGLHQPTFDQINFGFRRRNPLFRFLLKDVQHVNSQGETDGVDRPVCVAIMIVDNFQNASTTKAFQGLCAPYHLPGRYGAHSQWRPAPLRGIPLSRQAPLQPNVTASVLYSSCILCLYGHKKSSLPDGL